MEVIQIEEKNRWNTIVNSFQKVDIYYQYEYVKSLLASETAQGLLFYFHGTGASMCFPMLVKDISEDSHFKRFLPQGLYFDMETPYGYGGPLFDSLDDEDVVIFRKELYDWCNKNKIVSQFVRFNPVSDNVKQSGKLYDEVAYQHHTIFMDTTDKSFIMSNMDTKNRNMVRKALKNGVEILIDDSLESIDEFKTVYHSTMDYHNADEMYYFPDEYYNYLKKEFLDHILLFRAVWKGKTISSALFFYDNKSMHYHLSGTLQEFRSLASANLLLYEAACWAAEHGIPVLHLGGGLTEDDSLFGFKKQFNRTGYLDFWIGKTIFMPQAYQELLDIRCRQDSLFNIHNSMMIQYRR